MEFFEIDLANSFTAKEPKIKTKPGSGGTIARPAPPIDLPNGTKALRVK